MPRDLIDFYIDSEIVTLLRESQRRVQQGWSQRVAVSQRRAGYYAFCMSAAIGFNDQGKSTRNARADDSLVMSMKHFHAEQAVLLAVHKLTRNRVSIVQFNDVWTRIKADIDEGFEVAIELQIRKEQGLVV